MAAGGNILVRKQENERIFKENMILFNKLKTSTGDLRKRDHDAEFSKTRKFLHNISKAPQLRLMSKIASSSSLGKLAKSPSARSINSQTSGTFLPPISTARTPLIQHNNKDISGFKISPFGGKKSRNLSKSPDRALLG